MKEKPPKKKSEIKNKKLNEKFVHDKKEKKSLLMMSGNDMRTQSTDEIADKKDIIFIGLSCKNNMLYINRNENVNA